MVNINELLNLDIKGKTKLYGLIGNPIEHTISPQIHNSLAKTLGIDMVYIPMKVHENSLEDAINGLKSVGFSGFNVTIPHKEKVIGFLDELDETARSYDAVNTVLIKDGRLIGYNTDADGFYRAYVESFKSDVNNRNILIIGAGGAASSVAYNLSQNGAASLTIANRTIEKANKICERISLKYKKPLYAKVLKDDMDISSYDIIINTTSVGMHPKTEATVLKDSIFNKEQKVVDIIYNPVETNLLKRARESGAAILNGFGMLYYQAVIAEEIWHSFIIPENIEKNIYETLRSNLGKLISENLE